MVGTHAGDMIGEIALAIEMGADAVDIGKTIHPHPTLGESIGMAAEVAHGSCTDLPPARASRLCVAGETPVFLTSSKSASGPVKRARGALFFYSWTCRSLRWASRTSHSEVSHGHQDCRREARLTVITSEITNEKAAFHLQDGRSKLSKKERVQGWQLQRSEASPEKDEKGGDADETAGTAFTMTCAGCCASCASCAGGAVATRRAPSKRRCQ